LGIVYQLTFTETLWCRSPFCFRLQARKQPKLVDPLQSYSQSEGYDLKMYIPGDSAVARQLGNLR